MGYPLQIINNFVTLHRFFEKKIEKAQKEIAKEQTKFNDPDLMKQAKAQKKIEKLNKKIEKSKKEIEKARKKL